MSVGKIILFGLIGANVVIWSVLIFSFCFFTIRTKIRAFNAKRKAKKSNDKLPFY